MNGTDRGMGGGGWLQACPEQGVAQNRPGARNLGAALSYCQEAIRSSGSLQVPPTRQPRQVILNLSPHLLEPGGLEAGMGAVRKH